MKKVMLLVALLITITPTAQANEIPGSRVVGQGAICGAGQGKGVEYNIALKQETSYCYDLPVIVPPTVQQVENKVKEQIATAITQKKNENPIRVIAEQIVTVQPQPVIEPLTKIEINVATKVTTITPLNEIELQQVAKDRAIAASQAEAKEQATLLAEENIGEEQCVLWESEGQSGQECVLKPILATEEEVENFWQIFERAFSGWYGVFRNFWTWAQI